MLKLEYIREDKGLLKLSSEKRMELLGWRFGQIGPDDLGWIKFDEDGGIIAQQGDITWYEDIKVIKNTH